MARPKGIWTPDIVRKRIQATKLADRLQDHAFGKVEMSQTQIKSAEILLRKAVPDLQRSELTGKDGKDLPGIVYLPPKDGQSSR